MRFVVALVALVNTGCLVAAGLQKCAQITLKKNCIKQCKWNNSGKKCSDRNVLTCPVTPGQSVTVQIYARSPIKIPRSSQLCTLTKINSVDDTIVQLSRSYHGNDWEAYGSKAFGSIQWKCDATVCSTKLPSRAGILLTLTTFSYDTFTVQDERARFLEQTTFGPTFAEIATTTNYASWMQDQFAVPPTSHREYYRSHANYRFENPNRMGLVTQPCARGTRYRRYAFTEKDRSRQVEFNNQNGVVLLLVDGQARTVVGTNMMCSIGHDMNVAFPTRDGL
jgi:hypothetical protein